MKKYYTILIVSILFITCQSCASYKTVNVEPVTRVFQTEGTKNELFVKANNWMLEKFNNPKSVVQFSDKEEGIVTGRYMMKEYYTWTGAQWIANGNGVFAVIKIQVKDGAAKITVDPDQFIQGEGSLVDKNNSFSEANAILESNTLIETFETYLRTDTSTDW